MDGEVAPGFENVRDAFGQFEADAGDGGYAYAAWHEGRKVVDLWTGSADHDPLPAVQAVRLSHLVQVHGHRHSGGLQDASSQGVKTISHAHSPVLSPSRPEQRPCQRVDPRAAP